MVAHAHIHFLNALVRRNFQNSFWQFYLPVICDAQLLILVESEVLGALKGISQKADSLVGQREEEVEFTLTVD